MASTEAFAAASIELYSRLWAALDRWLTLGEADSPGASARLELTGEIVRLEVHLLLNACDTASWRLLLSAPQRQSLKSLLQEIQLAFDTDTAEVPQLSIISVQNRLLEAILEHRASSLPTPQFEHAPRANRG
jgi:hypothetical protein